MLLESKLSLAVVRIALDDLWQTLDELPIPDSDLAIEARYHLRMVGRLIEQAVVEQEQEAEKIHIERDL